ncbi:transglutaminase-like putative cysteine protease [Peribacillus deserti]|uniref:Transglutaminase-like putative cysteine protease n=1 Tax=Peribacillus deserti TaxID=673318 RepID=A0ABS2QQG9_9BACI|nr:DUF4129 domain-containing transglutaminase family protein [Peribacillus deserti]MBM7694496.1 transglutaminase-like putative cysteine protease [Peribacillus deserti]
MRGDSANQSKFGYLLLYFLGFLLLWEWVKPLGELTDTGNLAIFVAFMGMALLLKYINLSRILRFSIITLYILTIIHHFYYKNHVLIGLVWIIAFIKNAAANIDLLLTSRWFEISNDFKTLLFFLLLCLMTYLISYWVVVRKKMLLFFLVSVVYVTVLDTFTVYHADSAIIRLIVNGFAILGIQTYYRTIETEKITYSSLAITRWMLPLGLLIACSVCLGFSGPKQDPIWPDPVPFIKSYSDIVSGQGTVSTVGYGENDDKLGGAFESDSTVVFQAKASVRHYWKVENKNFYTGKGWEVANVASDSIIRLPENEKLYFFSLPDKKKSEFKATVTVDRKYKHIPYPEPMGLTKVKAGEASYFDFDVNKEKILSYGEDQSSVQLSEYSIEYEQPRYDVNLLRKTGNPDFRTGIRLSPQELDLYTQLPTTVPQRVKDLAGEITVNKNNSFDQAKAIEDYFDGEDFVYDQRNVPFPAENQDYVDQFLFDTKVGYCDNYSTSMVVLLRSLGIPSRWAKGYSDGEFIRSEDNQNIYEITNNNAHSWVEVFFEGTGWVPFEPTKGFTNSARFQYPASGASSVQASAPQTEQKKATPVKPDQETAKKPASSSDTGLVENLKEVWENNKAWAFGILLILSLAVWGIYRSRGKWMPKIWLRIYKNKTPETYFLKTYPILLSELDRYGLKRPEGQTLREYAGYVDSFFYTMDMIRLTGVYEHMIYKGESKDTDWKEVHQMWERLMNKTIA